MLTQKRILCKCGLMANLMFTDGLTSGIIPELFIAKNADFFSTIVWLYQY